jgi:undecaprenyl-diphosphatase
MEHSPKGDELESTASREDHAPEPARPIRAPWLASTPPAPRSVRFWHGAELLLLLGALLCVLGVWAFVELASSVARGEMAALDQGILVALRWPDAAHPRGPGWLAEVARDVTALGSIAMLALATAAVAGYLALARRYRALVFLLTTTLGGVGLSFLLKAVFARPPPAVADHLVPVSTASFPSGHATLSAAVYLALCALLARLVPERRLKLYVIAVALFFIFLVGASRIYLGVHHPSDVLAGWLLGLSWGMTCWVVDRWLRLRRRGGGGAPPRTSVSTSPARFAESRSGPDEGGRAPLPGHGAIKAAP